MHSLANKLFKVSRRDLAFQVCHYIDVLLYMCVFVCVQARVLVLCAVVCGVVSALH